jgi:hypothetical protein
LHAGVAANELQELTATSEEIEPGVTGALFELRANGKAFVFGTGIFAGAVTELNEANLQKALEEAYGAGDVKVSEKASGSANELSFLIESVGADAGAPVPAITVVNPFAPLSPVTARVVRAGRPDGDIVFTAINVGDAAASGETTPVKITSTLPKGLRPTLIEGIAGQSSSTNVGPVTCEISTLVCSFAHKLQPFEQIEIRIGVAVETEAHSGELAEADVSGGGAPAVRLSHEITVNAAPTSFGAEDYSLTPENEGGSVDTQAGSHPFQLTTTFDLNQTFSESGEIVPAGLVKDLTFKLPPGLVGDPTAYPRCTLGEFAHVSDGKNGCPADSVLGVAVVSWLDPKSPVINTAGLPLFNLEPKVGEPARFGFQPATLPVFLDVSVRTGEDYGVTVHVENILQTISFVANTVTLWGVPGDERHALQRGYGCLEEQKATPTSPSQNPCEPGESNNPAPFLALPTSCTGELQTTVQADSWLEPYKQQSYDPKQFGTPMSALDGCGLLPFGSEIKVSPDVQAASTPTGLKVDVHVPQEEALNPEGLSPADVKNITVALPEGVALNAAASDGLEACTQAQVALSSDSEAACPNASKIANATITSPLLPNPLKGFVYLASPQNFSPSSSPLENPFGSLVAMYLVVKDPVSGVIVKLPGSVSLSPSGQITATFANNPQLPFEDAELEFFGGERAPLATPGLCRRPGEGGYVTQAAFEPWTNGEALHELLHSTSEFNILSAVNGGPCPNAPGVQSNGSLPFSPSLASETTNINAGSFTPLSTTLTREDGQQNLQSVTLHYPPGVSGDLTGIPLCPEAQANAGTCSPGSQIGETIVSVGLGGDPFSVTGGKVYITEKYDGAPFGLSIVNPAKAGPFDLQEGRPVVVRAKIEIDPITSTLTIVTDPSGAHVIPTIIEGIPLQIKHVNVLINRPGFTFNPTNCNPMKIEGAISSAEGASSPVSVPFQVTNCSVLGFKPKFTVSTSGKTSRSNGASLDAKIAYPKTAWGTQANIASVKVKLPRQLPSRLSTLQKACTDKVFNANPANCPAESRVGTATTTTPIIPVPLSGPVYFVSHAAEKFPELIIVLSGYGVTVDLHGETYISKTGITSTTFRTVPDVPVGSFELKLPEGKYSALAANGNLCKQTLLMPTRLVAQNGTVITQNTKIAASGCAKPKSKKSKHKKKK